MKLKAFTLIETLAALAISSVVIGLAAVFFLNIQKYSVMYEMRGAEISEVVKLAFVLQHDNAESVVINGENRRLLFNMGQGEVLYEFGNDWVLREHDRVTDTFYVQTRELLIEWHPDLVRNVTSATLMIVWNDETYKYYIQKDYTNSEIFNHEVLKDGS